MYKKRIKKHKYREGDIRRNLIGKQILGKTAHNPPNCEMGLWTVGGLCFARMWLACAIEPGAFETGRANPRTCPQRDATSPAPRSHTTLIPGEVWWGHSSSFQSFLPRLRVASTDPVAQNQYEGGRFISVGWVLLGLVRDAGSGAK